jgi:hypothetical protein
MIVRNELPEYDGASYSRHSSASVEGPNSKLSGISTDFPYPATQLGYIKMNLRDREISVLVCLDNKTKFHLMRALDTFTASDNEQDL